MAYNANPMSQYNKSNPFVMLAKREYTDIMDTLQEAAKYLMKYTLISVILFFFAFVAPIVYYFVCFMSLMDMIILGSLVLVLLVLLLLFYFLYKKKLKEYIGSSEAMKDFDRISNLELNEILKISNEELLVCLHKMYSLKGCIDTEMRYMKICGLSLMGLNIAALLINLLFYITYFMR